MNEYVGFALILLVILCFLMSYLWYDKGQQFQQSKKQASAAAARFNQTLHQANGKVRALEEQVQSLTQEKTQALNKYRSTDILLTNANTAKAKQEVAHKGETDVLRNNIRVLEEKLRSAVTDYQTERRRNLITEKTHIQDTLNQLAVLEKNLVASEQAFT